MNSVSRVERARPIAAPDRAARDAGLQQRAALRPAAGLAVASVLMMGLGYAIASTSLAGAAFPAQANGSLLLRDGQVVGSSLVAQPFAADGYFQTRPSAAGYDPMAAAGSNMARSNPALQQRVAEATAAVAAREGVAESAVPSDLVTQSGGGMDPELSPRAVALQVPRVARARGLPPTQVQALVSAHTQEPRWGVFGQPRVNVMTLNLALDAAQAAR